MRFIEKNKFAEAALDENIELLVPYISSFAAKITIYLARKAQISLVLVEEVTILIKCVDFVDVFSKKSVKVLLK